MASKPPVIIRGYDHQELLDAVRELLEHARGGITEVEVVVSVCDYGRLSAAVEMNTTPKPGRPLLDIPE